MPFGTTHPITDICFVAEDVERSVAFYVDKLGFELRMRAEGFADFKGAGITLALWERGHFTSHIGLPNVAPGKSVFKAIGAMEMKTPAMIDEAYKELAAKGVAFVSPPKDYPWRARCVYFLDPDENVWELYAWLDGKPFGTDHST
jgi:catechol 2,3-dioxygenase-like lactoylglutathione lyase family enzyme